MEMITLNKENIDKEHICCAISSNNDIQVKSKKAWLLEQFEQGLIFTKMDVRGKCFIEYLPIENAWIALNGKNMMYINCLWVAGKYQGLGYAKALLESCKEECVKQNKDGIVILSNMKKSAYVMDYKFLVKHGFKSVDTWGDYELMYYAFHDGDTPSFNLCKPQHDGFTLYYTHQCPFNAKYVEKVKEHCVENNITLQIIHIESRQQALEVPTPFTTYSLFYKEQFITREVMTPQKFDKIRCELNG